MALEAASSQPASLLLHTGSPSLKEKKKNFLLFLHHPRREATEGVTIFVSLPHTLRVCGKVAIFLKGLSEWWSPHGALMKFVCRGVKFPVGLFSQF